MSSNSQSVPVLFASGSTSPSGEKTDGAASSTDNKTQAVKSENVESGASTVSNRRVVFGTLPASGNHKSFASKMSTQSIETSLDTTPNNTKNIDDNPFDAVSIQNISTNENDNNNNNSNNIDLRLNDNCNENMNIGNINNNQNEWEIDSYDLIAKITESGIRCDDPRLVPLMEVLDIINGVENNVRLSSYLHFNDSKFDLFNQFICRILNNQLIVRNFDFLKEEITRVFNETKESVASTNGKVADYIPELARVDKNLFAACVCTVDGQRFCIGDSQIEFCVQSTSKPVTYLQALSENGIEYVHKHVGVEPRFVFSFSFCLVAVLYFFLCICVFSLFKLVAMHSTIYHCFNWTKTWNVELRIEWCHIIQ